MKRYSLIIAIFAFSLTAFGQNQVDALRYSALDGTGTARFTSMAGAFSSLGGDFSAISLNPAGLGVYRSSEFTFTPSISYTRSQSDFLSNSETDFTYNVNMGNIGYVGTILIDDDEYALKSMSFGFGYNNLNNFDEVIEIEGENTINSMTDHFASRASGSDYSSFDNFYLSPAWETYLFDPIVPDTNVYMSAYDARGQSQRMDINRKGHMGEYVFSMGLNFNHELYIGASFGIQNVSFSQNIFYKEEDPDNLITDFNSFNYTDRLEADGTGYNFKIGAIYRPIDWMRVSAALHTPTFYNMYEEYSTNFSSTFVDTSYSYASPSGYFSYSLISPLRVVTGMSFIVMDQAIVSLDYEFLDYSISKLRSDDYSFNAENDAIQDAFKASHAFKVGAEYKLGLIALRGGYSYITNPYATGQLNSGNDLMKFSGGFGFRTQSFFFDMAYVYQNKSNKYLMYEGYELDAPEANIDRLRHSVLATIGFRF
ncbi:MAG: hypothetical protein PF448_10935 [Bacteroidales bacterium]|jgi:hypothetical protein|nr:hypothetical protein [Bacteroidales bacterium]